VVKNRSAPPGAVVPGLCYEDTAAAIEWLTRVFGFEEDVRWGPPEMPSAQLTIGEGAIFVFGPRGPEKHGRTFRRGHSWTFTQSVADVDPHEWASQVPMAPGP
jgi:uncharacterized glyoxalase superfamily protein PhnB